MSLRDKFEKLVEKQHRVYSEPPFGLFEKDSAGYIWPGLENRFRDFQAGHSAGLEDAAVECDSIADAHLAINKNDQARVARALAIKLRAMMP